MSHPVSSRSPLGLAVTSGGTRRIRVAVAGDLDAFTVADLVRRLRALLVAQHPVAIQLDLSAVSFVDTTAGELTRFHGVAAAAGCALTIDAANEATWWLFGSLGLAERFPAPED
ncbi:STAS domain-containing protein [Dactylosporangium cerinum]|uniref:STAS domain-containing protein n=1 Tax=Dactylosporangium cerinum TaxID=1434730 RepID=A0ABV9WIL7_9ACTN